MAPRRTLLALALIGLALTAGVHGAKKADKKKGGKENVLTGALFLSIAATRSGVRACASVKLPRCAPCRPSVSLCLPPFWMRRPTPLTESGSCPPSIV